MTRAETVRDLRQLADWLEANPAVPVPEEIRVQHSVLRAFGDGRARLAEIGRVAGLIGATVQRGDWGAIAERAIGRGVKYVAYTVLDKTGPKP